MKICKCEHDSHFGDYTQRYQSVRHKYGAALSTVRPIRTPQGVVQKCHYCRLQHTIVTKPSYKNPQED